MLIMLLGAALAFLPQLWVKNTYNTYRQVGASTGMTGAEFARRMLSESHIYDVVVEETPGELSDHYDPSVKAVRLSPDNYHQPSVASVTIAAHEVGHAIQHQEGYLPVVWRSALVPAVNLGSRLGPILIMLGLGMGVMNEATSDPSVGLLLAWVGVFAFSLAALFHLVTLPVELDASRRALTALREGHYMTDEEQQGAKKILTAAAFTYVATALYSLIQVLYWVMRILGSRERRAY